MGRGPATGRRHGQRQHGSGGHHGHLARPRGTVFGTDFLMLAGGKGANQAIAATRAGAVGMVTMAARAAREAGTRVLLNAAPAQRVPAELLDLVDLLIVNEAEARAIDGHDGHDPAALLSVVPRAVLTRGGRGAWYGDRDGTTCQVPGAPVDLVD